MACDSIRTLSRGGRGPCSCLRGVVVPPPRPDDDGGGGWSILRGGSSGDGPSAAACVGRRKRGRESGREEFNIRGKGDARLRSGEREEGERVAMENWEKRARSMRRSWLRLRGSGQWTRLAPFRVPAGEVFYPPLLAPSKIPNAPVPSRSIPRTSVFFLQSFLAVLTNA
jgi:hypothetical protein